MAPWRAPEQARTQDDLTAWTGAATGTDPRSCRVRRPACAMPHPWERCNGSLRVCAWRICGTPHKVHRRSPDIWLPCGCHITAGHMLPAILVQHTKHHHAFCSAVAGALTSTGAASVPASLASLAAARSAAFLRSRARYSWAATGARTVDTPQPAPPAAPWRRRAWTARPCTSAGRG